MAKVNVKPHQQIAEFTNSYKVANRYMSKQQETTCCHGRIGYLPSDDGRPRKKARCL